jgi:hypothetical protein
MSDEKKKDNMFAKLAQHNARANQDDAGGVAVASPEDTPPSPAPTDRPKTKSSAKKIPERVKGKRDDPDYCQANAYIPKALRRSIEKAILDVDDLDYSTLVEDLLRKWLKSRGVSA